MTRAAMTKKSNLKKMAKLSTASMLLKMDCELPPHMAMAKPAETTMPAMLTAASHHLLLMTRSSRMTAIAVPARISSGISSSKFNML
ncbi:hypothetical protein ES708_25639 [subsurface metagenome]